MHADGDERECRLLSGEFAVLIQVGLMLACLAVLAIKRCTERPRRRLLIWLFDVSKQFISSSLQHGANLLFGLALARQGTPSECGWYLVQYVVTSTAAIPVVTGLNAAVNALIARRGLTALRAGEYGTPPSLKRWLAQLAVWSAIGLTEKCLTTATLVLPLRAPLGRLAAFAERPLRTQPHVELVVVMVVVPVGLNLISAVVWDNLLARRAPRAPLLPAAQSGSNSSEGTCGTPHLYEYLLARDAVVPDTVNGGDEPQRRAHHTVRPIN